MVLEEFTILRFGEFTQSQKRLRSDVIMVVTCYHETFEFLAGTTIAFTDQR